LPVHISDGGVARHRMELESAVYFTCVEGMQNASKHALDATGVGIQLREFDGTLYFEVRDDGLGIQPDARPGRGLQNMRDRVAALGGHLTVQSQPGKGTHVMGSIRLADV
jgi:signal transduction histidine kinase